LAVAYKGVRDAEIASRDLEKSINDLVFVGLIFLEDPVREEAKEAIQTCYRAGMRPIIITGDHGLTAKAVANKLGLNIRNENIMEGRDLEKCRTRSLPKNREYPNLCPGGAEAQIENCQSLARAGGGGGDDRRRD